MPNRHPRVRLPGECRRSDANWSENANHKEAPRTALKTPVSEAYVRRVLAEVEAGQATAGVVVSDADREIARRQVRGELSGDEAVREAIDAALVRFPEK